MRGILALLFAIALACPAQAQYAAGRVPFFRPGFQFLTGIPSWVTSSPAYANGATMITDFTQPNSDGTYGQTYLRSSNSVVKASSIWSRTGTGGTAFDASGNVVSFTGSALRTTSAGLTTEEARTNLITFSNAPTTANGYALENGATTAVQTTGPGSGLFWYLFDDGTAVSVSHRLITPANTAFTSGTAYTYSVIINNIVGQFVQLGFPLGAFGSTAYANFDIVNGAVGTIGSGTTAAIKSLGANGFMIAITATATASATSQTMFISAAPASNSARTPTYTGNHNQFLVWNQDVAIGAFATTPIPTTSAAVTRAQDGISASNVSWLAQGAGTLQASYNVEGISSQGVSTKVFGLSDNSSANRIYAALAAGGYTPVGQLSASSVTQQNLSAATAVTANSNHKIAFAYSTVDGGLSSDGVAATRLSGTYNVPTISFAGIGLEYSGSTGPASGTIAQVAFFPTSLSNSALSAVTQ